jgi:hypothetical protein
LGHTKRLSCSRVRDAEPDGLFSVKAAAFSLGNFENWPTDSDSRRNRVDFESAKFSFEFKSTNF